MRIKTKGKVPTAHGGYIDLPYKEYIYTELSSDVIIDGKKEFNIMIQVGNQLHRVREQDIIKLMECKL